MQMKIRPENVRWYWWLGGMPLALMLFACGLLSGETISVEGLTVTDVDKLDLPPSPFVQAYLSPDGERLVWRDGNEVCIGDASADDELCIEPEISMDESSFTWSPDGRYLAFTENFARHVLEPDLWLLDAGTGDLTNLTDDGVEGGFINSVQGSGRGSLSLDVYPEWSSDSKQLFFIRVESTEPGQEEVMLYSIDIDDQELELLAEWDLRNEEAWMPDRVAWSSDGGLIAYSKSRGPVSGLWVAALEDGEMDPDRVFRLPWGIDDPDLGEQDYLVEDLAFSDDGDYLLVSMMNFTGLGGIQSRVIDLRDGKNRLIEKPEMTLGAWAPSGAALAYTVFDPRDPDEAGLYLVQEPGEEGERIYSGRFAPPRIGGSIMDWAENNTILGFDPEEMNYVLLKLGDE
ncbi:MAG: hypothetical protein WA996_01635 [Candidatus Promineifilaceae bacterium]